MLCFIRRSSMRVAFSMDPGLRRDDIVEFASQARIRRQNDMSLTGVSPDYVADTRVQRYVDGFSRDKAP
ncbi:hypothetical protein WH87_06275 [Devosia epidermidihirudinis]|uniref:Uncharacterized protein n=1 Tax=Devosia epidermidihirudinis TaxID=1293439 RepID=A0A0F5QGB9_9HYPH|nr:hypothetical protein WH87_06275 [Devosia epidermidihirudinis]